MSNPSLTLYFDVVSPFAYLAFYFIKNSTQIKQKCTVRFVPALLGGIMKTTGNTPPIAIKKKRDWIYKERIRWAEYFNIPMSEQTPDDFPFRTIEIMRVFCAVQLKYPDRLPDIVAHFYSLLWVERRPVHKTETYTSVIRELLGELEGSEILRLAETKQVKDVLMAQTNEAVDSGAFGMPWFVATNAQGRTETYWGFDHLGQVMDHLGLERQEMRAML